MKSPFFYVSSINKRAYPSSPMCRTRRVRHVEPDGYDNNNSVCSCYLNNRVFDETALFFVPCIHFSLSKACLKYVVRMSNSQEKVMFMAEKGVKVLF